MKSVSLCRSAGLSLAHLVVSCSAAGLGLLLACGLLFAAPDAGDDAEGLTALVDLLGQVDEPVVQLDLLQGMNDALRGRKHVAMPAGWKETYAKLAQSQEAGVREKSTNLALIFGDPQAIGMLRKVVIDPKADAARRQRALGALVENRVKDLAPQLQGWLQDPVLRSTALRGLAAYEDPQTPVRILAGYASYSDGEKQDAVNTLCSRPAYALALLDAVEQKQVASRDISAFLARQLHQFGDEKLNAQLARVWGTLRPTARVKHELIAKYKETLSPGFREQSQPVHGRLVFQRNCLQCHRLFEAGGNVGPDLTGSNRANIDYVLENLLDPSALIGRDFQLVTVVTTDGRLVNGIIREQTASRLVLQTINERVILDKEDVEEQNVSPVSMMPEGMLDKLSNEELRDLLAYLASPMQVPLPEP